MTTGLFFRQVRPREIFKVGHCSWQHLVRGFSDLLSSASRPRAQALPPRKTRIKKRIASTLCLCVFNFVGFVLRKTIITNTVNGGHKIRRTRRDRQELFPNYRLQSSSTDLSRGRIILNYERIKGSTGKPQKRDTCTTPPKQRRSSDRTRPRPEEQAIQLEQFDVPASFAANLRRELAQVEEQLDTFDG